MVRGPWTHNTLVQLAVIGHCTTQQVVNVFHFEATGAEEALYTDDSLAQAGSLALAQDFNTNRMSDWLDLHTQDYVVDLLRAQVLERPANVGHRLSAVEEGPTRR